MPDKDSKLYPHVTGVNGNDGEDPSVLVIMAVLDPSPNYPEVGRIIVGSPRKSDKLEGHIPNLGGFCCGVDGAKQLITTLQQAVSDVEAALGRSGRSPQFSSVMRGLRLMKGHFDEDGHDWTQGTDMADIVAACEWIDAMPDMGVAWKNPDGFVRIGRLDAAGRRSLWLKEEPDAFELRAGRGGDDIHLRVTSDNPLFHELYDAMTRARFAAEFEHDGGLALTPMGIERFGYEDPEDEIEDEIGRATTVYHLAIHSPGRWKEDKRFRVIVRAGRHFAVQHRINEADTIEGRRFYWEPVTEKACGIAPDQVLCALLVNLRIRVADDEAVDTTVVKNVTTIELGTLDALGQHP